MAAIFSLRKVVVILLALSVLVLILASLYSGKGLLTTVAEKFKGIADEYYKFLDRDRPDITMETTKEIEDFYNSLYQGFVQASYGKDCLVKYNDPPSLGDFKLEIFTTEGHLYMRLLNKENQEVKLLPEKGTGPKVMPCVIAGNNNQANNFYFCHIDKRVCNAPMYSSSTIMTIEDQHDLVLRSGTYDLEDNGLSSNLLFNFGGHVCFFTTFDNGAFNKQTDPDGLNDDLVKKIGEGQYKIQECSGQKYCTDNNILACKDLDKDKCNKNPCEFKPECLYITEIEKIGDNVKSSGRCTESYDKFQTNKCSELKPEYCIASDMDCMLIYQPEGLKCLSKSSQLAAGACTFIRHCGDYVTEKDCGYCTQNIDCRWLSTGPDTGRCQESSEYCNRDVGQNCGAYTLPDVCQKNPCNIASGCTWEGNSYMTGNRCRHTDQYCQTINGDCVRYEYSDVCENDPCTITGGCQWFGEASESCLRTTEFCQAVNDCTLYSLKSQCEEDPCNLAVDCRWDGSPVSCITIESYCTIIKEDCARYLLQSDCKSNPCNIASGCTWSTDEGACEMTCSINPACSEYTTDDLCESNRCQVSPGCTWEGSQCIETDPLR